MPGASALFMFLKQIKDALSASFILFFEEVPSRFELLYAVLQTAT